MIGLCALACTGTPGKPDAGEPPGSTSRAAVVNASAECALVSAREFRTAADALKTAVAALAATPDAQTLEAARAAFHTAFDAWQVNESLQFGPAAPSTTPGGNDMRDQIDSWPLYSRCAVEQELIAKSYERGARTLLVNRRGMPALEFLLFYEGDDTVCVPESTWTALSSTERAARRRAYAAAVASDVAAWASELVSAWDNGFKNSMITAGSGSTIFGTTQAALNVVSDAVFYIDKSVKDTKLARPLGFSDCAAPPCLDLLESPYAHRSKRNIAMNVTGMKRLLVGCSADNSGVAFDDLLVAVGAEATAQQVTERTAAAEAALAAIEEADLDQAIVADQASVVAVHDAMRSLTSILKTEFLTVLDLEMPKTLEGDND